MKDNNFNDILNVFKENTKYIGRMYPFERYAFGIDFPSANTVYFRTKYFGDWKDNVQVSFSFGDDFFRISCGDDRFKSKDLNQLNEILSNLHKTKVEKYGVYLTNEYSDYSSILNDTISHLIKLGKKLEKDLEV